MGSLSTSPILIALRAEGLEKALVEIGEEDIVIDGIFNALKDTQPRVMSEAV